MIAFDYWDQSCSVTHLFLKYGTEQSLPSKPSHKQANSYNKATEKLSSVSLLLH